MNVECENHSLLNVLRPRALQRIKVERIIILKEMYHNFSYISFVLKSGQVPSKLVQANMIVLFGLPGACLIIEKGASSKAGLGSELFSCCIVSYLILFFT